MIRPEPDDVRIFTIPDDFTAGGNFDPDYVPGSRKAEEEAAIAELLATLPDDQARERMSYFLNTGRPYRLRDPDHARLLTTIYEIRDADGRARALARSVEMARGGGLDITVALVNRLPMTGARAMIRRLPKGKHYNLILVCNEASATDFADAVAVMFAHRRALGDEIYEPVSAAIPERTRPIAPEREARFQRRLKRLRAAPVQEIPGIGHARAMTIMLGPVRGPGQR